MRRRDNQLGIALLQVLLISIVISLIALQFTFTSRNHVRMAKAFEDRIVAQLLASSAINEVIFAQLSETVTRFDPSSININEIKRRINLYGAPVPWSKNVDLTVQDLNGLLPQIYPQHVLWRHILERRGMDKKRIDDYLGTWEDLQDPDIVSWRDGDSEPLTLPSGERYLDGYAQTDHPMRWIFKNENAALKVLSKISDVNSPFDTNILNSPEVLIDAVFQPEVAAEIKSERVTATRGRSNITYLLPKELQVENIYQHDSAIRKITVSVANDNSGWSEEWHVMLTAAQKPPFRILGKK
jgi:hypothetical protein